jgi:Fe-S cluster biogenesis protein NfuA/nitrite reductase/ring-hydroxylating ferredoxin subunit
MIQSVLDQTELQDLAKRVDTAVQAVRDLKGDAREKALAMKTAIEEFHKSALTRMIQSLKSDPHGKELLFAMIDEPEIYAMLSMHSLIRPDLATRVRSVIENVRPYMQSHGGDVELLEVTTDTVKLRLAGSCNGCSQSAVTLRNGVEEALRESVPEISHIEVAPNEPGPSLISVESLLHANQKGWIAGPAPEELTDGKPFRIEGENSGVILLRSGNEIQAFRNACAHMGLPLDGAMVDREAGTITCPWHGFRFDCRTGECLTAPHAQLEVLPLRLEGGIIHVRPS